MQFSFTYGYIAFATDQYELYSSLFNYFFGSSRGMSPSSETAVPTISPPISPKTFSVPQLTSLPNFESSSLIISPAPPTSTYIPILPPIPTPSMHSASTSIRIEESFDNFFASLIGDHSLVSLPPELDFSTDQ